MEPTYKRETAYHFKVSDLLSAQFMRGDGAGPNYVLFDNQKISRVNLIGTLIDKKLNEKVASFSLDDGFGHIVVSFFDDLPYLENAFQVGDTVVIIGRVTDYNGIKINGEVIRKIDKVWASVRKKELDALKRPLISLEKNPVVSSSFTDKQTKMQFSEEINLTSAVKSEPVFSPYQNIWQIIREKDTGDGVDFDMLKESSRLDDEQIENSCQHLLKEGEIYEIRPGFYKVLE